MSRRVRLYFSWDLLRWGGLDMTPIQICLIVILCFSVMMLGLRVVVLITTHYLLNLEGSLVFFRTLSYTFAWMGIIAFFYSYYKHKYDKQNDRFADTYRMKTTTLFAAIASLVKFVASLTKLVLGTPENLVSIIYLCGELVVWFALFLFFLNYYKRMRHMYNKMLNDVGRIKL